MNFRHFLRLILIILAAVLFGLIINLRSDKDQTNIFAKAIPLQEHREPPTHKLLTKTDMQQAFREIPAKPPTNKNIFDEKHYNVAVARVTGRNGPPEQHSSSDRIFFIRKGSALMRIGGRITDPEEISSNEYRSKSGHGYADYEVLSIKAGSVLSVPRNIVYQIVAEKGDVSFTVVRIN